MKFRIINIDGSEWTYNNLLNKIEPLDGSKDFTEVYKQIINAPTRTTKVEPFDTQDFASLHKDKNLKKLRIQLGLNCNYKCSFCIQGSRRDFQTPVVLEDGINAFFQKMDDTGIELHDFGKIELWGGEPLVYLKSLQYLLPRLRERYPNANLKTISNGTLITPSTLAMLLDYKVNLVFSHDAQAYFLRGKDPLDDPEMRRMWMACFNAYTLNNLYFGINTVVSQYNADLFAIQEFFAEKLSPEVPFGFEGVVMAHAPNSVEFTHFPKDKAELLKKSIFKAVLEQPESHVGQALNFRMMTLLRALIYQTPSDCFAARCDTTDSDVLGVDLFGNVLSCHNVHPSDQSIGRLDDYSNIHCDKFTHWSRRNNCPQCPYLVSCKGACMRNDDKLHHEGCAVQKMFHGYLFECAWAMLTGSFASKIELLA